jgi:hypothetical protein
VGGGWYRLTNSGSGKLLDDTSRSTTAGTQLQQLTAGPAGQTDQQWSVTPADNGYVTVTNELSGLVVGASGAATRDNAAIDQETPTGAASQQWQLVPVS